MSNREWRPYGKNSCTSVLEDFLSLRDYAAQYLTLPQVHFVGTKDKIIPQIITADFVGEQNIIRVEGATHGNGWSSIYPQIWAQD